MNDAFANLAGLPVKRIWDDVTARIIQSELITMAIVELAPNATVPGHHHPNEQLGFVIRGGVRFTVGGLTRECGPGDTWRILADVPHHVQAGPEGAVVAEVYSPVRQDWAALPDHEPGVAAWPDRP